MNDLEQQRLNRLQEKFNTIVNDGAPTQVAPPEPITPQEPVAPIGQGKYQKPTEFKNEKGEVVGHITSFGKHNRLTTLDEKTKWVDENGKEVAAPKSMQMMEAMNDGFSPTQGTASSWERAIAKRRYDALTLEARKRKQSEYNMATSDVAARAMTQLNAGQGEIKQTKNGDYYRVVRFGADDENGPIAEANKMMTKTGRPARLRSIVAAVRVDKDGNVLKGEKPQLRMVVGKTDGVNSKSDLVVKNIDIGKAMTQFSKAFAELNGVSESEANNNTYHAFGGKYNPLGWDVKDEIDPVLAEKARQFDATQSENARQFDARLKENARQFDATLSVSEKEMLNKLGDNKGEALAKAFQNSKGGTDVAKFMESLPKEFWSGYLSSGKQAKDADGNPMSKEDGTPLMEPLPPQESLNRIGFLMAMAQRAYNGGKNTTTTPNNATSPNNTASPQGTASLTPAEKAKQEREKRQMSAATPAPTPTATPAAIQTEAVPKDPNPFNVDLSKEVSMKGSWEMDDAKGLIEAGRALEEIEKKEREAKAAEEMKRNLEENRRRAAGITANNKANFLKRYKTVQDVARGVVKALNDNGKLSTIVNPDGTRRTNLSKAEKDMIIHNVRAEFDKAGMGDYWLNKIEEYTPQNAGRRLSNDAILDKLFKDWKNITAPHAYGYKKVSYEK